MTNPNLLSLWQAYFAKTGNHESAALLALADVLAGVLSSLPPVEPGDEEPGDEPQPKAKAKERKANGIDKA